MTFKELKKAVSEAKGVEIDNIELNIIGFNREVVDSTTGELLAKYNSRTGKLVIK